MFTDLGISAPRILSARYAILPRIGQFRAYTSCV
jgi:hypothetical protein